jgi:hypothetical protein
MKRKSLADRALELAARHISKMTDYMGTCEVCPLDDNGCPFGDEFPATIVCYKKAILPYFLAQARRKS